MLGKRTEMPVASRDGWEQSIDALFRLLTARLDIAAIGVFRIEAPGARLWAATEAFRALPRLTHETGVPPVIDAALEGGVPARIDARELGRTDAYAAIVPILAGKHPVGYLLALDQRRRWLGPRAAAELRDAARLLAALMTAEWEVAAHASLTPADRPVPVTTRDAARLYIESARRAGGPGTPLGVAILDLDRFRAVNDALGAAVGDRILQATWTRITGQLGTDEAAYRLDGDRFLILARPDRLEALAEGVLKAVRAPIELAYPSIAVHASIGLAADTAGDVPAETLLRRADSALKRAKLEGRNRWVRHEARLEAASRDRSQLEIELTRAADTGQMGLVFQPYVALADGRICGAEALLRWRHPLRGELQPAAFIPIAERTGQIVALGNWALRRALSEAQHWPDGMRLSVNVSALQFRQPEFIAQVDRALAACDFPASRLELEITETVLMRDHPETIAQLRALIARGIQISLDDFGTGYSALAYLAKLPHHRIKLDRTFVQDLANPATVGLIRAIVASARAQGIAITAEGVETQDDLDTVRRLGFTHAQGFATGAPVADASQFLGRISADALT